MKYVNSLKYMNGFERSKLTSDISLKRTLELCESLGRVHVGNRVVYMPSGTFGHAASVMLESVIMNAGYKVGRITSSFGDDSREVVYIDGERASIDDYNLAVAELKSAVLRSQDLEFFREEAVFAMSLLICKMNSCDYVIMQGIYDGDHDLASLCAPYDLVIVPTISGQDDFLMPLCNAIRRGAREVISGTQKKNEYDLISKACFTCGARLTFTSKQSFHTESLSSIERGFSYADRGGYTVKSPSSAVAECAMLVIESALAIRRSGIKLPWASISEGLSLASGTGCFEILSASPLILLDSSGNESELELFISSLEEVFGAEELCGMALCIPASAKRHYAMLEKYKPSMLIFVGEAVRGIECEDGIYVDGAEAAARLIMQNMRQGIDTVCFGSVRFEAELSREIMRSMGP